MATKIHEAFDEFHKKLLPTTNQKDDIKARQKKTREYLIREFNSDSDMPLTDVKLIGSADRGTIIRPIDDVDVLAVFSDENEVFEEKYHSNSFAFMQRIRTALSGFDIKTIGVRGQAVRLIYTRAPHVDIAPVFHFGNEIYVLPTGDGSWMKTSPAKQQIWFDGRYSVLGESRAKKITRVIKRWNSEHSRLLKSFHLEVMVASVFSEPLYGDTRAALNYFFNNAYNYLDVNDPAGFSGNLGEYLPISARYKLRERLANASARAEQAIAAEKAGGHKEAIRLWGIELGEEFPSYN